MNPKTEKVKASMLGRLERAGFNLNDLGPEDYPEVQEVLGWKPSTYKTALRFLGQNGGDLEEGFRDYIPTQRDISALKQEMGHFIETLAFLGCRFSEVWQLGLAGDVVTVNTKKRGERVQVDLREARPETRAAILQWIRESQYIWTPSMIRRRWDNLKASGRIDPHCVPHSFRHRLVTALLDAGHDPTSVAKAVGHKDPRNTMRYRHNSPSKQAQMRRCLDDGE